VKPVITIEKPSPPVIKLNEGARAYPIVRSNPYLAQRQNGVVSTAIGVAGAMVGLLAGRSRTDVRNDNRQDNRQVHNTRTDVRTDNRHDNRQYADNRQVTNTTDSHDQHAHLHGDIVSTSEVHEENYTQQNYQLTDSHNVQAYSSNQYSVTDDHSQTYSVQSYTAIDDHSTHITNNTSYDDHSMHVTDNSRHYAPHFTDVKQSVAFGIFFGGGLEKVLMMLVVLAILTVIFFSEVLVLAGALCVFIMGYLIARAKWKQRKFAREMEEREKDRQHQIKLAEAGKPITIQVGSAEVLTQILATDGKFTRIKEAFGKDVKEAKQAYGKAAQGVGKLATETAKSTAKAAAYHGKRQSKMFIKGFKEEVLFGTSSTKRSNYNGTKRTRK